MDDECYCDELPSVTGAMSVPRERRALQQTEEVRLFSFHFLSYVEGLYSTDIQEVPRGKQILY